MGKRIKQLTAGAMAAAFMASSMPMESIYATEFAAKIVTENNEETFYESFNDAVLSMTDQDTLYLCSDSSENIRIREYETWNIDFTGYTYSGEITVPSSSSLCIIGGDYVYPFDIDHFSNNPEISISDGITCDSYSKKEFEKHINDSQVAVEEADNSRKYVIQTTDEKAFKANGKLYASPNRAINALEEDGTLYIVEDSSYDIENCPYDKTISIDAGNNTYYGSMDLMANVNFVAGAFAGSFCRYEEYNYTVCNGCRFGEDFVGAVHSMLSDDQVLRKDELGYYVVNQIIDDEKLVNVNGKEYSTIERALEDVNDTDTTITVNILGDYELPITISYLYDVKLVAGSNTISSTIENYGTLEIASGVFDTPKDIEEPYWIATSKPVTITGGEFRNYEFYIYDIGNPDYYVKGGTYSEYAFQFIEDCIVDGYEAVKEGDVYKVKEKCTDEPEYTIKYELDGGVNNSDNPQVYKGSSNITLLEPTKSGYVFEGWYTDSAYKNRIDTISNGTSGNLTLYAKWSKAVSLNGICYILNDKDISMGVAYTSNVSDVEFRWLEYNLDTQEWNHISDWSSSNWSSWKPAIGNYWLQVQVGVNGETVDSYTIYFVSTKDYSLDYLTLDGFCYIINNDRIDVGTAYTSNCDNVQFKWLSYNVDTQVWETISDWTSSNWVSWNPNRGNYWVVVYAKTNSGKIIQNVMCFAVSKNYKSFLDLNGICYITRENRIDVGVAYDCSSKDVEFRWLVYNLESGTWEMISNWNESNWTSWYAKPGNYWLHVQAQSRDGEYNTYTICFTV